MKILDLARQLFGGVQSEAGLDFAIPHLDRCIYLEHSELNKPYADEIVPFYPAVYHGLLLYNVSAKYANSLPGESAYLHNIEYGGLPLIAFHGHFLTDEGKNWIGSRDFRWNDGKQLQEDVTRLRAVADDVDRLAFLQLQFIDGHVRMADGVYETVYSDGSRVVVNYNDQAYTLPNGKPVPPHDYALIPPIS